MEIRYTGKRTRTELLRMDGAVRKAFGLQKLYTNAGCFTVAAVIGVPLAVAAIVRGDEQASVQWFILGGAASVIAAWQWWSIRRSIAKNPLLEQEVSGALDDAGFEMSTPTSKKRISWAGFSSVLVTPTYLLLIGSANETFGLSSDFFSSPGDFASACSLAQAQVPGKPPASSWRRLVWSTIVWIVVIIFVFLLWSLFQKPSG